MLEKIIFVLVGLVIFAMGFLAGIWYFTEIVISKGFKGKDSSNSRKPDNKV